jgi:hypothetical protein
MQYFAVGMEVLDSIVVRQGYISAEEERPVVFDHRRLPCAGLGASVVVRMCLNTLWFLIRIEE